MTDDPELVSLPRPLSCLSPARHRPGLASRTVGKKGSLQRRTTLVLDSDPAFANYEAGSFWADNLLLTRGHPTHLTQGDQMR